MKNCALSLILSFNVFYLGMAGKEKRGKGGRGNKKRGKEEECKRLPAIMVQKGRIRAGGQGRMDGG
jgi:hypothetical protein